MTTNTARLAQLAQNAARYGVGAADLATLLRAERTLRRWYERECGDSNDYAGFSIERDEATDLPYWCVYPHTSNTVTRTRIRDLEAGAKRRIAKVLAGYPGLVAIYQGDPRGCALSIARESDIPPGSDPLNAAHYGLAICAD